MAGLLAWAAFPAAVLLGPMIAAVAFSLRGASLEVPRWASAAAQAVVGRPAAAPLTACGVSEHAMPGIVPEARQSGSF